MPGTMVGIALIRRLWLDTRERAIQAWYPAVEKLPAVKRQLCVKLISFIYKVVQLYSSIRHALCVTMNAIKRSTHSLSSSFHFSSNVIFKWQVVLSPLFKLKRVRVPYCKNIKFSVNFLYDCITVERPTIVKRCCVLFLLIFVNIILNFVNETILNDVLRYNFWKKFQEIQIWKSKYLQFTICNSPPRRK